MTPEPRRVFTRRPRTGRTLTPRGVRALILCAIVAAVCVRLFGAP